MQTESQAVVSIFVSYAPEDQTLEEELKEHLRPLEEDGHIFLWENTQSSTPTTRAHGVNQHLNTAEIILLLISPDFLATDYYYDVELKRALERHEHGEARVIPIIVRPVHWQEGPLGYLQALPKKAQPVTVWSDRKEAWRDVVESLSHVVDETRERPKPA